MRFSAPWDRKLRIATTVVAAAMTVGAALLLRLAATTETPFASAMAVALVAAFVLTLGLSFALAPGGYSIDAGRLWIERPLRAVEVPLASIRAAGALPSEALRGWVKVAGSGGLFGYYGRFWSRRLGSFRLYATRRTGLVFVDTAAERFVLSPEPPERFLEVLFSRATSASRALPGAPLPARPTPRGVKVGLALLFALVPVLVGGIAAGIWAFSPCAVRVERGEIRIERKLAPDVVIPVSGVRRVEQVPPQRGRRLWRVAGTSVPGGVRYGHFRSPELGDVQLYAWRSDAYVLLDAEDGRVVVTPDDPEAFVSAVREGLRR
jgi:uncharacterized membrane protein